MTITKKHAEAASSNGAGSAPGPVNTTDKVSEMQHYSNTLCAPGEWNRVDARRGFISITVPQRRKSSPGSN